MLRKTRFGLLGLVLLAVGATPSLSPAQIVWQRLPLINSQDGHNIAYDAARQRLVLVCSKLSASPSGRTESWEWDGSRWNPRTESTAPLVRPDFGLAYDSARGRLVLFGGGLRADTWESDGTTWTQRFPATSPPARYCRAMAYDAARQRVVLFGGQLPAGTFIPFGDDTWEWDGTNWSQRFPATRPPRRIRHAMAYDAARQRMVLFGGYDQNGTEITDTWTWDGVNWTRAAPATSPPAATDPAMAFDSTRQRIVLFVGETAEVWEWDGTTWQVRPSSPNPGFRYSHAMAYDPNLGQTVLFGGAYGTRALDTRTWSWNGTSWRVSAPANPPERFDAAMAYDAARDRVVLFGGLGATNDTWEWDGHAWNEATPTTSPSPRWHLAMAYDEVRQRTVLFGGDDGYYRDDTWEWNGTNWSLRSPAARPPARGEHGMTYDSVRQRVVLFGGRDTGNYFDDTWEWDGTNWALRLPLTNPARRLDVTMTFDKARGVALMFGGWNNTYLKDLWSWDGTNWTLLQTATQVPAWDRPAIAYDALRQRVVLFEADAWEWDGNDWLFRMSVPAGTRSWNGIAYHAGTARTVVFDVEGTSWEYYSAFPATSATFGVGCGGAAGVPVLQPMGLPWIGTPYGAALTSLPSPTAAVLLLGASNTSWGSVPLPLGLAFAGLPPCQLLVSPDLVVPMAATAGSASWTVTLATPSLAGASFYQQGLAFDPSAGLSSLVMSNGVAATVGAK